MKAKKPGSYQLTIADKKAAVMVEFYLEIL